MATGGTGNTSANNDEAPVTTSSHSASSGAIYIPWVHTVMQRQIADQFFKANRCISKDKLNSLAVSAGKMVEFMRESFVSDLCRCL